MPTYDYHCKECGHKCEIFQKITDEPQKTCPHCGKEALQRGPGGGIGFKLTGSGFYKTDYGPSAPPETPPSNGDGCCPCGKNQCG